MRPVSAEGFLRPAAAGESGAAPMLRWLAIADLVIDDLYQRPIGKAGRKNVNAIAAEFRWSRFGAVVVSPVVGGKYAIVDGQHRTTAALVAGFDHVPCQVIVASLEEQARAFFAINGRTTRISALSLHKAAVAAGDDAAGAIERVAAAAGVTVLRYPVASDLQLEPGQTMAVATIGKCLASHGEATTRLALQAIAGTRNNVRGGVLAAIIMANAEVLAQLPARIRGDEAAVLAAFDRINLIRELSRAQAGERSRGTPVWRVLADRLGARLDGHFGLGGTVAA